MIDNIENEFVFENIVFRFEHMDIDQLTTLANAYYKKLDNIVQFMIEHDEYQYFGNRSAEDIKLSLGQPTINVDTMQIIYLNHTIDQTHIISLEYSGVIDKLYYFTIDG